MTKTTEKLWNRLLAGETFYFKGQLNDNVFKWEPGRGYSSKGKDGITIRDISVVKNANLANSLLEFEEITQEEYDNFKGFWNV